jgi:hypothetical protein
MHAPGAWCGQSAPFSNFNQIPPRGCYSGDRLWKPPEAQGAKALPIAFSGCGWAESRPIHGIQTVYGSRDCALAVSRVQLCGRGGRTAPVAHGSHHQRVSSHRMSRVSSLDGWQREDGARGMRVSMGAAGI